MKKALLFVCFFNFISVSYISAQTLSVDDTVAPLDLITNLITSNCDTVSEVSLNNDGSGQSVNSYGSFTASGNTSFSFTSGALLTTGSAVNAGTNGALNIVGEEDNWSGSNDYENAIGLTPGNSFNATEVQFNFLALKDNVSIDYVFASEEYAYTNICSSNEGVVILIKESTAPDTDYTNIALVPGTSLPVTVGNIHSERLSAPACSAVNESYLGGSRGSTTPFPNYSQYTSILQAQTNSLIGVEYTVKIIVADENDANYDSAVFVGPIDNEQEIEVSATYISDGSNIDITNNTIGECGEGIVLQLDSVFPSYYTYEWFMNDVVFSNENGKTLSVTTSGSYTVRVYQSTTCFSEETIVVNLSNNQIGNDLSALSECVSSGNTAIFNLTDQDTEALEGRTTTDVVYSGSSGTINSSNESAYTGTNGEVITATVTESSGCIYSSTFSLNVEIDGSFLNSSYTFETCDSADPTFNDGFTAVFPSDIEPLLPVLTSGSYTYYDNNNNVITDAGVGTFTSNTNGYSPFRIEYNSDSGCASSAELLIQVNQPPSVTVDLEFIEICDVGHDSTDQDGLATFNMTPKYDELVAALDAQGNTGYTITFYPSLQLAEQGLSSEVITDIASYENEEDHTFDFVQLVGIRIENDNGCPAYQQLQLKPRYLISNAELSEEELCDPENDGYETFDLSTKRTDIVAGNDYEAFIYRSFADAETDTNVITDSELASFTNEIEDMQRLWVRIVDLDTGCVDYDEEDAYFDLIVNSQPTINTPTTTELTPICDLETDGQVTGLVDYFNAQIANEITTDSSIRISYFNYEPDPLTVDPLTALTNSDTNVVSNSPVTYWAMGSNISSGCFSEPVSFQLQVNPAPTVDNTNPNTIYVCYDGSSPEPQIPVDQNNAQVVIDQTEIEISYYTTENAAITGDQSSIEYIDLNGSGYTSTVDTSVWYRIEKVNTGCFFTVEQPIIVNTIPVLPILEDFTLCVDPGDTEAGFLLSSQDNLILNGETDKVVKYFLSNASAETGNVADELDKDSPYDAVDGTEIFVRVENTDDSDCYNQGNISSFILSVAEYSTTGNAKPELTDCGLFGTAEFDLQTIIDDITLNGTVDLQIEFYEDPNDAGYVAVLPNNVSPPDADTSKAITDNDNNPNTLMFENTTPLSQEIFVRIENPDGCITFQTFDLLVSEIPIVEPIIFDPVCDIDGDENEIIDLSQIENLTDLDFNQMVRPYTDINEVDLNYFVSQAGADAFMANGSSTLDNINDPTNFQLTQTGETSVFLVITANTTCAYSTEFKIQLDSLPIIISNEVFQCEDAFGSNQFTINLDTLNDEFDFYTEGDADVRLDYYSDAAATMPLSGQYTKTSSVTAIYLQAVNTRTTCISNEIIEIPLTANTLPTIGTPTTDQAVVCENDGVNDGTTVYALNNLDSIVLNGQNATDFTVDYFDALDTEMFATSEVVDGQTYTAIITNNTTECQNTTNFVFTVNQLPEIEALEPLEFCDDDEVLTNTTIVNLTDVVANFIYVTSEEAKDFNAGGVLFYTNEFRTIQITDPENYNKIGEVDETIYIDLISENDCVFQTEFVLHINPIPVINSDTSNPIIFCEDVFGTAQHTFDLDAEVTVQVLGNPSEFTVTFHTDMSATNANQINNTETLGTGTIYIKVISNSGSGCENIEPINLEVLPLPTINPVSAETRSTCDEDGVNDGVTTFNFNILTAEVLGSSQSADDYSVTYHESEAAAENNITFDNSEVMSGTYYVKVQNLTTFCSNISSLNISVNQLPEIDEEEIFFCENNPSRLFDKNTGDPNDEYLWEFSSDRTSQTTSDILLSVSDIGSTIRLTVTNSVTGCENEVDFLVQNSPTPIILPIVTKNFDTDEVTIEVTDDGDYLFALTKTADIPDASEAQESNLFTDLLPGKYYAHVIDLNGCGDVTPLEVSFIDYYPFFTPNGSGPEETETWHIKEIDEIPNTQVFIYNRFGLLLTVLTNTTSGWDGNYKGKPVPSDDYWILIKLDTGEVIKDHITLKR